MPRSSKADGPSEVPRDDAAVAPLSWAQELVWRHQEQGAPAAAYLRPLGFVLPAAVDRRSLQRAVDWLVARHDALRIRVEQRSAAPLQRAHPPQVGWQDPGGDPLTPSALESRWAEAVATPIDVRHEPPVRVLVDELIGGGLALLLVVHAIAVDAWSLRLLGAELMHAYERFAAGRSPSLPPPPMGFLEVARAQWARDAQRRVDAERVASALPERQPALRLPRGSAGSGILMPLPLDLKEQNSVLECLVLTDWATNLD